MKEWFLNTFSKKLTESNIRMVLIKASDIYYNNQSQELLMTDSDFDKLSEYYYNTYKKELPVGAPVKGSHLTCELKHSYKNFAGTLSKSKNLEDFDQWMKSKKLDKKDELGVSIKADGNAITIEFVTSKKGVKVDKVLTRGQNGVGKDLTEVFKHVKIPHAKNLNVNHAIGYEAVVLYDDFIKLDGKYKNPRSAIGGLLSGGKEELKLITLIPIRIITEDGEMDRYTQLKILRKMENFSLLEFTVCNKKEVKDLYNKLNLSRNDGTVNIPFMFDGIVVEAMDFKKRKKLDYSSSEPNFANALKFTSLEQETIVENIIWKNEGHSSRLTPVVEFKPVIMNGNTYKQVSIANLSRFKQLNLSKGSRINFSLRHDVLGYVEPLKENNKTKEPPFKEPTHCPSCGDKLNADVFLYCVNPKCLSNIVGSIYGFIEKIGIKNIGLSIVRLMCDKQLNKFAIDSIGDLFTLEVNHLHSDSRRLTHKIDGIGKVKAENIIKEIRNVFDSPIKDYMLLGSIGIDSVGRTKAKLIFESINTDKLIELCKEDTSLGLQNALSKISGIGELTALKIHLALNNTELLREYEYLYSKLDIETTYLELSADFKRLTFCHTGSAEPVGRRDDLKELIESKGHKLVLGAVSKNTDYLINNDSTSSTSKNVKAKQLGVPIVSVEDALKLI